MNLGACVGYTGSLTNHRLSIGNSDYYATNVCNGKNFLDGKNYRWIIKCIDDGKSFCNNYFNIIFFLFIFIIGYGISTDFIEYMQNYCELLQDISNRLTSYSNKWKSKLKHQSSLSSYHTTKRAQLQVVRSPEKLAQLIQTRCDAIQKVITAYKKEVNRMYPSERFTTIRKHYRSNEMERSFKNAYSYLRRVSDRLENLREREKKAEDALREAKIQCQNLELNETTSKNKLSRANDNQENKQRELQSIKENIIRTEEEYNQERETYREKATEIYQRCRVLEQERLDQIRDTLLQFIQAIHPSEYSTEQDAIYENLLSNIDSQQDTLADLDFWAQTYRVSVLAKPVPLDTNETDDDNDITESQQNETADLTPIEENTDQLVVEDQEEQSVPDRTTTSRKTKPKKKKNNTAEPSTPDAI